MKKKNLEYIISKIFDDLDRSVINVSKGFTADDIHDFRLQVRELRALLRMLSIDPVCSKKFKVPRRIKYIYTVSGRLRDLQICRGIIKYYFTSSQFPENFLKLLKREKDKYTREFKKAIDNKRFSNSAKKLHHKIHGILRPGIASYFYDRKIGNIRYMLSRNDIDDEGFHHIRKNIKDIQYINKLATNYTDYDVFFGKCKIFSTAEQLAYELGQINDLCTVLAFLKPSRLNKIPDQEKTRLYRLRQQCFSNKESLKAAVFKKLIELDL